MQGVIFNQFKCILTQYIYKDYIKSDYNHIYQTSHLSIKDVTQTKKHTSVLIISNL